MLFIKKNRTKLTASGSPTVYKYFILKINKIKKHPPNVDRTLDSMHFLDGYMIGGKEKKKD